MDEPIHNILKTIDYYYELLENPETFKEMDIDNITKSFQASMFIEKVIKKVQDEKKEAEFDSHLNAWMIEKKKCIIYKCSNLHYACDKFLEFCLKQGEISNEIIDELLKMYIENCGSVRLETNIKRILRNSMLANIILQSLIKLDISESDVEDEIIIASWEHGLKFGNQQQIIEMFINFFHNEQIPRLINLAHKAERRSLVNILILDYFAKKLEENHILLYNELKNTKKKVLLKLLVDNSKFQVSFVDITFYIGRNMVRDDDEEWITDTGFSYNDLKYIIQLFLNGPGDLYRLTVDRIKLAKELDEVWEYIERDCIL